MFLAERFWPEQKIIIIIIIIIINIEEEEEGEKKENQIKSFSTNTQAITNRAIYMCDKRAYCKEEKTN
jgi:hypothetical protein